MNLENTLLAVIAIFGVIVGSVSTYFSQSLLLKKQIKRYKEKEKELKLVETMDIYSKFLDVQGNVPVLQKIDLSTLKVDLDKYEKHIRPILMEKIYLIHDDVSQIIMNIKFGWINARFNSHVKFESGIASYGIIKKMMYFIVLVLFMIIAFLLVPEKIASPVITALFIGYLVSEINSILSHLELTEDGKKGKLFRTFISRLVKVDKGND